MGEKGSETERVIPRQGDDRFPSHDNESWIRQAQANQSGKKSSPKQPSPRQPSQRTQQPKDPFDV